MDEMRIEKETFFKLPYGLYLLCARQGERINACIINTCMQITEEPYRVLFALNNATYTAELLHVGEACNLSVLSPGAPFEIYRHFGYQSGREVDKFAGRQDARDGFDLPYLNGEYACAVIGGVITSAIPCGTHTVYVVAVREARVLSSESGITYEAYRQHVKPQQVHNAFKTAYVCRVCGYVYEGEELPPDYVCPVCHHGADAFEKNGTPQ